MTRKRRIKRQISILRSLNTKVTKRTHISVIMLIILLLAGLMIGFIWQKVKMAQLVAQIEDLRRQEQILKERNEKKRVKVLNLLNNSRIIKIAQQELEMDFPPFEIVALSDDFKSCEKLIKNIMAGNK